MKKRITAFMLILVLLVSVYPLPLFASGGNMTNQEIMTLLQKQEYKAALTLDNGSTYFLNPHVYREQHVVVYSASGSLADLRSSLPENQPTSKNKDKNGNWRVLGYSKNGTVVYNSVFVPDVKPAGGNLSTRNWVKNSGAKSSWKGVKPEMQRYMLEGQRATVTAAVDSDTIVNILGTSFENAKHYAICQAVPGLRSDGTIKMYHQTASGSTLYWTFRVPELGAQLYSTIFTPSPLFRFCQC